MSNLNGAIVSLQAELATAKDGHQYYANRVDALSAALEALNAIGPADVSPGSVKTKTKETATKGRRGRKPGISKANAKSGSKAKASGLPFTGGDFWTSLIGETPQSTRQVLDAAVAKIDSSINAKDMKKLEGRMTFALNSLVNKGEISDSGKGRERVFFKA